MNNYSYENSVTLTSDGVDRTLANLNNKSDLTTELQTIGEELAMSIIERLGANAFSHVPDTFEYYLAVSGAIAALKACNTAIADVRNSWQEDGVQRTKTYRKRAAQLRAGHRELDLDR